MRLGAEADLDAAADIADRDRVEALADTHPRLARRPVGSADSVGVERLDRQRLQSVALRARSASPTVIARPTIQPTVIGERRRRRPAR